MPNAFFLFVMSYADKFKTVAHPVETTTGITMIAPPFIIMQKILSKDSKIKQREEIRKPVNCSMTFVAVLFCYGRSGQPLRQ